MISNLTTPILTSAKYLGNENATIDIIEFGDYQDPVSARFNQVTKDTLISKYVDTGIVRFGFKDLVINDFPKDKLSTYAAEATYCASDQVKYWDYHDELYKNSRGENTGLVTKENLITFAKNINISDISQFTNCLDSHKYATIVGENDKFAKEFGFGTAPFFIIFDDKSTRFALLEGAQSLKGFSDVIDGLLNNTGSFMQML